MQRSWHLYHSKLAESHGTTFDRPLSAVITSARMISLVALNFKISQDFSTTSANLRNVLARIRELMGANGRPIV